MSLSDTLSADLLRSFSVAESLLDVASYDGTFCPNAPVTRAEMAVFIEAALSPTPGPTCTGNRFTDVTPVTVGGPFCAFIERLAQDGITGGCTPTTFCPFDPVTRAQMAVFLTAAPPPLIP